MRCLRMRNVKYAMGGFLLSAGVCFLTGCGMDARMGNDMKNVEERDYATILLIEENEDADYHFVLGLAQEKVVGEKSMVEEVSEWDAENLDELAKNYGNVTGKDLSLAHLKMILVAGQLEEEGSRESDRLNRLQRESWMEQLLYMLEEEDEIAKTCAMLELREAQGFIDFLEDEEEPVGNYLENLVRMKERQGVDVPWLKDYLKALRENEKMEASYLVEAEEGWEISAE